MSTATIQVRNNELLYLIKQINEVECNLKSLNSLMIDTANYASARPHVMAVLTSFLKDLEYVHPHCEVSTILPKDEAVRNYMTRMKFYRENSFEVPYPFNEHDPTGRFIELKTFNSENKDNVIDELSNIFVRIKGLKEGLKRALSFCFSEIIDNSCCHAESPIDGLICAQTFYDRVEIAIVDRGIGIPSSLKKVDTYQELNSRQLLEYSIKEGVSSRKYDVMRTHQGFGMFAINEFVRMSNGKLEIFSNDACLITQNGLTKCSEAPNWKGTVIYLTFFRNTSADKWEEIWDEVFRSRGFEEPYLRYLDEDLF